MSSTTTVLADAERVERALAGVLEILDADEERRSRADTWGLFFDAGLSRVDLPIGCGGLEVHPKLQTPVSAAMSARRIRAPFFSNVVGVGMAAPAIAQFGTSAQHERHLRRIFTGEDLWCQLFSEPGAGSDLSSLSTSAVRDGEHWVINGQKVWTTMAHVARWGLLLARTGGDQHGGITCFALDMNLPGIDVRPLRQITGDTEFNEVFLNDVQVADEHRIGEVDAGWGVAMGTLMNERVAGDGGKKRSSMIDRALREWERVPADQRSDARRHRLVDLWCQAQVFDLTRSRSRAQRRPGAPGPEGSILKLASTSLSQRVAEFCLDVRGAEGMLYDSYETPRPQTWADVSRGVKEAAAPRVFLRSRANSIEGGTTEVQKNTIAERVLGLPR